MKTLFCSVITLGLSLHLFGSETTLATYDWQKLAATGQLSSGTLTTNGGRTALYFVNTNLAGVSFPLLAIQAPAIKANTYALRGEVRYEAVQGDGYLEMWSYFAPEKAGGTEGQYFSRTLGSMGPMRKITGNSDWRIFTLPFDRTGAKTSLAHLKVNLVLPGQGRVWLGNLSLVEFSKGLGEAVQTPGAWFSDQTAGLIGGLGGAFLGCFVPALTWLARGGRCRSFVLGTLAALVVLGVLLTIVGIVALALKQPYGVWFVFLLMGVLLVTILPSQRRALRKSYDDLGLRKLTALG